MKKGIILVSLLLLLLVGLFTGCSLTNSFEFKVSNVYIKGNEGFILGTISKGEVSNGDIVKIQRDGKDVKSLKILELISDEGGSEHKIDKASKGQKVGMTFQDISTNDIGKGDMIVK